MSTHNTELVCGRSILEAFKAIYNKKRERIYNLKKKGGAKETNTEFGTRCRIFGV